MAASGARAAPGTGLRGLFLFSRRAGALLADLLQPRPRLFSPAAREQLSPRSRSARASQPGMRWLGLWVAGSRRLPRQSKAAVWDSMATSASIPTWGLPPCFLANVTEVTAGPIDQRSDQPRSPGDAEDRFLGSVRSPAARQSAWFDAGNWYQDMRQPAMCRERET